MLLGSHARGENGPKICQLHQSGRNKVIRCIGRLPMRFDRLVNKDAQAARKKLEEAHYQVPAPISAVLASGLNLIEGCIK